MISFFFFFFLQEAQPSLQMADRHSSPGRQPAGGGKRAWQVQPPHGSGGKVLHKLHEQAPNPTQLVGILTLVVSGGILLLLTGLTVTGLVMGLIFFIPLLLISSPIWIPVGTVLFIGVASMLSMCGFAVAVLSTVSWLYRYGS